MKTSNESGLKLRLFTAGLMFLCATTVLAAGAPVIPPEKFVYCTVCHGVDLKGNSNLAAPRISGMEAWYTQRQLEAFRSGWRGTHDEDKAGIEMRPMAQALAPQDIQTAARFVHEVSSEVPASTVEGDAGRGAVLFQSCAACHGAHAEGNESVAAPALTRQNDWYLLTQLNNYRNGIRGQNNDDTFGQQMSAAVQVLEDDEAIQDVVTYLSTLQHNKEN
jgi:cytochrome c553